MTVDAFPATDLSDTLLRLLRAMPGGSSEYQLIQTLRADGNPHLSQRSLQDPLVLFRTHFLVFNALYRLREQLWQEQAGHLEISPLSIRLLPYQTGSQGLSESDPLRDYYLDMNQLHATTETEVEQLLDSFWKRLDSGDDQTRDALRLFELEQEPTLNLARIRLRYRQLVSRHHPDRGGSTEHLQSINAAMEILERHYR
ncbi:MAG TPA: DNA-J related domain-containing protein [Pseudomonas sp.]|nr:DNA-J related domain-containing protein [Pseudomonas sp.]